MPKDTPAPTNVTEARLNTIVDILERMNSRDRWRTAGGFVRSLISLIPMALFVWSTVYFFLHSDEIMKKIVSLSAEAAVQSQQAGGGNSDFINQLKQQYGIPK